MAASTARASHNPDSAPRGIYKPEEFHRLADSLLIPDNLRETFKAWYRAATSPTGQTLRFFVEVKKIARERLRCERTVRSHIRKLENLQLVRIAHKANSAHRPTTHEVVIPTLYLQEWPDGKCALCGHNHNSHEECGQDLGARRIVFRRRDNERGEKLCDRRCRCRASAPRRAPVPIRPPDVPKPAQPATAPHDHRRPARQPILNKLQTAKFAAQMQSLIDGRTRHVEQVGGYGYDLRSDDPRYRAPMHWREALETVAKVWRREPDVVLDALTIWGYKFEESEGP